MNYTKKIRVVISLMAVILFTGCASSYQIYKSDCVDNSEIQKIVLNKTVGVMEKYNSSYYDKLEKHCMDKYNGVSLK